VARCLRLSLSDLNALPSRVNRMSIPPLDGLPANSSRSCRNLRDAAERTAISALGVGNLSRGNAIIQRQCESDNFAQLWRANGPFGAINSSAQTSARGQTSLPLTPALAPCAIRPCRSCRPDLQHQSLCRIWPTSATATNSERPVRRSPAGPTYPGRNFSKPYFDFTQITLTGARRCCAWPAQPIAPSISRDLGTAGASA